MEIFQAKNRGQTVVNTKEGRSLTVDIKLSTVSILHRGAPSLWNHGKLNNLEDQKGFKKRSVASENLRKLSSACSQEASVNPHA
jgi:hypothetical protein